MPTVDWREVQGRYIKDPRLGHRFGRNYPAGEISDEYWNIHWLGTDKDGLIHNGNPIRDYELNDKNFKRVFVFGGSTAMGLGANDNEHTISASLERSLTQLIPNARVANCGCGAYMSWHQLTYLSLELIAHKPDFIVVIDGHNDFLSPTWGNKGLNGGWIPNTHRSLDDIVQIILNATGDTKIIDVLMKKYRRTWLGKHVEKILLEWKKTQGSVWSNSVWGETDYTTWSVKQASVDSYINNIKSTIGIARAHGVKIIYLLQPQIIWGTRKRTEIEDNFINRIAQRMPPILELAPKWFSLAKPRFLEVRDALHDGENVWVEDASDWLNDETNTVYHDWAHYNKLGQKIIAEKMSRIVLSMVESKQPFTGDSIVGNYDCLGGG